MTSAFEMEPHEYEQFVSEIADRLKESKTQAPGVGSKNRIPGLSGYMHQIDVSLMTSGRLFIIECKHWNSPIGVAEVLVLAGRHRDIEANLNGLPVEPIMVSTMEPTAGAKQLATHFGIALEKVKSATEYGLRLGSRVAEGVLSIASADDTVTTQVIRNGQVIPD